MKRRRRILSDDEEDWEPSPKKRKQNKSKRVPLSDTTNTSRKNKKQSTLNTFLNLEETKSSESDDDNDDDISSVSSIDDPFEDGTELKWSPNQIRGKIRKLLTRPDFKITKWLKEIGGVNSNSYGRFMKLKGTWNGTQNSTYSAAYRYFLKQEKIKKKKQQKNKKKPAAKKKKEAEKKKKLKAEKEKNLQEILKKIKNVDYNEDEEKIYDDCNDVRKGILKFLKRDIMSKARFLKEIGNVQHKSYNSFMTAGPLKNSGGSNSTYPKAYHFLEKLRIAEGVKKSKKRLENEREYPNGFELWHDNGRRWIMSNQYLVRKGDKLVVMNK